MAVINKSLRLRRRTRKIAKAVIKSMNGCNYSTVGGVFPEIGAIKKLENDLAWNRVNSYQKPDGFGNHIAVEFEFFCPIASMKSVQRVFVDAGLAKHVTVKWDGSIDPPSSGDSCGHCSQCEDGYSEDCEELDTSQKGYEIAVMSKEEDIEDVLKRVCSKLREIGADTNDSCGVHVHFDARNRNHKLMFHNLVSCQDLLFKMIPAGRRGNNYCKPQTSVDWENANYDRYTAINKDAYNKHQTVEVRLLNGTIKYKEVVGWIRLLKRIVSYNMKLGKIDTAISMRKELKLNKETYDYINEKVTRFAG